jgi:hypothetical protein
MLIRAVAMAPEGKKVKVGMMECISLGISPDAKVKGKGRGRKFIQRRQTSSGTDLKWDRPQVGQMGRTGLKWGDRGDL